MTRLSIKIFIKSCIFCKKSDIFRHNGVYASIDINFVNKKYCNSEKFWANLWTYILRIPPFPYTFTLKTCLHLPFLVKFEKKGGHQREVFHGKYLNARNFCSNLIQSKQLIKNWLNFPKNLFYLSFSFTTVINLYQ